MQDDEIIKNAMAREITCIWRYADGRIVVERMDPETRPWRTLDYLEIKNQRVISFTVCANECKTKYTGAKALELAAAVYL